MASLGDLTLFINAETNRASKDINDIGRQADKVSSKKRDIDFSVEKARNSIRDFKRDLQSLGEASKAAFKVAKMEGVFDDEIEAAEIVAKKTGEIAQGLNTARKPAQLLKRSFDGLAGSTVGIVNSLAKVGFALYGIQQITGALKAAFGGLFATTVGESIRLEESILKTQTALVSTNDVFRDGEKITDNYEAINALTGKIEQRIASIRDRSLELAGVTSNEVIEVFGMVAQQVGQIGGNLKDAEDLAISFAGALGTFSIPLYQARQEIGSILRGNITTDSYLAKALGITNKDIERAKSSTEGVVGFLEKRLQAANAGQKIAAMQFSGVTSNIADFRELIGQAFGDGLLQPMITGLTKVYDMLVMVKDQALSSAAALGNAVGRAGGILGGAVSAGASAAASRFSGAQDPTNAAGNAAERSVQQLSISLQNLALDIQKTLTSLVTRVSAAFTKVAAGLSKLAAGFVGLNVEVFKSLLETFKNLAVVLDVATGPLGQILALYGELLQQPIVQFLASVGAQFKLLEAIGVTSTLKVVGGVLLMAKGLGSLKVMAASVAAFFAKGLQAALTVAASALQGFSIALQALITRMGVANPALAQFATSLSATGAAAKGAATSLNTGAGAVGLLGVKIKGLLVGMLKFNLILLAVQLAIGLVVEGIARFQRAQKEAKALDRFNESLTQLNTSLKDVNENSTGAQRALKRLHEANADKEIKALEKSYIDASKAVDEYEKRVIALRAQNEATGGGAFGNTASALRTAERNLDQLTDKRDKQETQLNEALAAHKAYLDRQNLAEDITMRRREYGKLNADLQRGITDFNRSVADREFSAQQELARRRLELFQAEEENKIRLVERRNRKLIEGEEGASAAALEALNTFISEKKRGELQAKADERSLIIANADVEQQIANYKFDLERKIAELKKKGLEMAIKEAELAGKKKDAEEAKVDIPDLDKAPTVVASELQLGSADAFAQARRSAQGVVAQINQARVQGQGITNADNLDRIVTSLLPNVPLEQLKDSAIKAAAMLDELGKGLDPETAQANADATAKNLIMQREVQQAVEGLNAAYQRGEITADEYNAVVAAIQQRYNGAGGILEQLKEEAALRVKANELLKQANQIQSLQRDAKSGTLRTDQNIIMGNAQMAAGMEFDKYRQNEILAEGRIESRRAELEQDGPMSEEVAAEFEKFANTELFNAERQAEMDAMLERFQMLGEVAAGVGNAISSAMTQGVADILSGSASVSEVLGNMFQGIADSFMQMAQKIIADMIKMIILKQLMGLFGGGQEGGGGMFGGLFGGGGGGAPMFGDGAGSFDIGGATPKTMGMSFFAKGGIVTGPTAAMIGEGGMNEAVVPLPNGKAIPVDFGKKGKMGGDVTSNVTVNVDQSGGSNTEMSGDDAGKLGKAIDVAVKRVIMEERRSGGMLHNGRR